MIVQRGYAHRVASRGFPPPSTLYARLATASSRPCSIANELVVLLVGARANKARKVFGFVPDKGLMRKRVRGRGQECVQGRGFFNGDDSLRAGLVACETLWAHVGVRRMTR